MSDLQQAISRLTGSSHYQELAIYKPPFNPFEVAGITYRERSHSKVLAWLLEDAVNKEFRQEFISWIISKLKYNNLSPETDEQVKVRLEHGDDQAGRIDVFSHFPDLKLAVGIEVKVWAGEHDSQIERYQYFLKRKYANSRKVVIFLTPLGEDPETSVEEPEVPVLNMSWDEVAGFIDNMQRGQGNERHFRVQFGCHLRREIVMNKEEKQIVKDMLRADENAKTIQRIIDNMPSLMDFSQSWKKIVAEVCKVEEPDSLEFSIYPTQRSAPRELKIKVRKWRDAGLPFTLMLWRYQYEAGVRVMLWKDDLDKYQRQLMEFAASNIDVINKEFPRMKRWDSNWRAVLAADELTEEPPHTLIRAEIYNDEAWEKEVKEKLENQINPLLNLIQDWVKKNA